MLTSKKIELRRSEIREALADLAGNENPSPDDLARMADLDAEYRTAETRFRAALVAEDQERREAGADLETRAGTEWSDLVGAFEIRQAVMALAEGKALDGATAEVVEEMRGKGGFQGIPIPWGVLEQRAGETVAGSVAAPGSVAYTTPRLFPGSVASRMGVETVHFVEGTAEYPLTSSSVTAGWADGEAADVAGPTAYTEASRSVAPTHNLGIHMRLTRTAMKSTGTYLEQVVRRDMQSTIGAELDKAVFLGTGANGQPLGLISGAATYGIAETAINADADWSAFRQAVVAFLTGNAAGSASDVRALFRPEVWAKLDDTLISGTAVSELDRLTKHMGGVTLSSNAIAAPVSNDSKVLLTTNAGGVSPALLALWGGIDLIRDPYTDAQSGGLRLTALVTADVSPLRSAQLHVLTGVGS